ncbi:MAG: arginyltransferase [Gammaproteobacteria bacterium]|nr:arginyltransferase [Gammaproteobacteria bacterium]
MHTTLSLYLTSEHPCGYYGDRRTANLVPDPRVPMRAELYSQLVAYGFRRSGSHVYRPHCAQCRDCIPCRIDVSRFTPNRSQSRCLKRNLDVVTKIQVARFTDEYFDLYARYINQRHGDSTMANPQPDDFSNFLLCDWSQSLFIESRLDGRLIAVGVSDFLHDGPSAVYSFFDPDESQRGLGTFAVLQQVWLARLYHLPHVYLGYWLAGHPKMDYKKNFAGLELFDGMLWDPMSP